MVVGRAISGRREWLQPWRRLGGGKEVKKYVRRKRTNQNRSAQVGHPDIGSADPRTRDETTPELVEQKPLVER